jgi:hypothetical protein
MVPTSSPPRSAQELFSHSVMCTLAAVARFPCSDNNYLLGVFMPQRGTLTVSTSVISPPLPGKKEHGETACTVVFCDTGRVRTYKFRYTDWEGDSGAGDIAEEIQALQGRGFDGKLWVEGKQHLVLDVDRMRPYKWKLVSQTPFVLHYPPC